MPTMLLRHHAMYYQDIGEGFPLLFGHSYLWDRKMWAPQIDRLSQSFRCIVPDLWSHGFSDKIPQYPYSIEQLSSDYYHLMKYLGLKEFGIVGHSVGGMWGTDLTLKHPAAVKVLVLMNTFVDVEPENNKLEYFKLLAEIERSDKINDIVVDKLVSIYLSPYTLATNPPLVHLFKSQLGKIPHERLAGLLELGYTIFNRGSLLNDLPRIKVPVLVASGSEDKPRPISESKLMAQKLINSKFCAIPNAGHIPTLEQPQFTTDLLESFLIEALAMTRKAQALP